MRLYTITCNITGVSGTIYEYKFDSTIKMTEAQCCDYILNKKLIKVAQHLTEITRTKTLIVKQIEAIKLMSIK